MLEAAWEAFCNGISLGVVIALSLYAAFQARKRDKP
jgi:hypothetical protein